MNTFLSSLCLYNYTERYVNKYFFKHDSTTDYSKVTVRHLGKDTETDVQKDESLFRRSAGFTYDVGVYDNHFQSACHIKVCDDFFYYLS